jgi:transcriptional regulator with XRE-family HTH domain
MVRGTNGRQWPVATAESPVLSGWLLGNRLQEARNRAGRTVATTARDLGIHQQTLRRWENAEVIPGLLQLRGLFDYYGVPAEERGDLEGLRERATRPGWWNGSGTWPDATLELLGMEMAAVRIRGWDLTSIPGLLQTPEYARLVMQAMEPNISPTHLDTGVELRTGRQAKVFAGPLREAIFMIDEMALARMPGGAAVRRAQITRLLTPPSPATIQVVPFRAGPHPAKGSFLIFDFDSDRIPAGVYAQGSVNAKEVVETGGEVARYEQVWTWLQAKALSPHETTRFLKRTLEGISDDE